MAEACEAAAWLKALPCAPEFRPSEAEFADPIAYISKIEPEARTYGICKIVPPYSRASKKTVMANLNRSLLLQSPDSTSLAAVHGTSTFEPELCRNMGGCMPPQVRRRSMSACCTPSQPRTRSMPLPSSNDMGDLKARFNTRRQQLGCSLGKRSKVSVQTLAQKLVWQSGESYTLEQFEAKAKQFTRARLKTSRELPPFVIESLFWKAAADRTITVEYGNDIPGSAFGEPSQEAIVPPTSSSKRKRGFEEEQHVQHPLKEPKLQVKEDPGPKQGNSDSTTLYRSLETPSSSGISSREKSSYPFLPSFAKERARPHRKNGLADGEGKAGTKLAKSCWNMRIMARSPGSLLRYMPDEVPGVTSPMVYIGMLFSWFAWHVEDHELHSLNYLHTGAPKTWYAVPGDAAPALEEVVRVYGYGNISDPKAAFALLGEKTTIMSPEVLLAAGVPCCRLVQHAGEFVVTFPRAYHLGFSHGFNCGEAANFATPAWLEVAKEAATRRAAMDYLPMLSHQQLLYLLALSICPRVTGCLAFESQISEGKDSIFLPGKDPIKTVFSNDVAHNHRLLGLLVDSGVTGCVLLGDGADLSLALSEHLQKLPCCRVDDDLKISSVVECETKTLKKDVAASPKDQDFSDAPAETPNISTMTYSSFRWGTLPCAACGLLCFPSMAVVQPVSSIENGLYPTKHADIGANVSLASFFMEVEDHAPHNEHLLPLCSQNDEESQSEFFKTSLTEAVYHPVASPAHAKLEQEQFLQWEPEQDAIQELHEDARDAVRRCLKEIQTDPAYEVGKQNNSSCSNGKLLDHLRDAEKTNAFQQDMESTKDCINNSEETPLKAEKTQDLSGLGSNKIGSVLLKEAVWHKDSSGCADSAHFSNPDILAIPNSGILGNIAEDCSVTPGVGNARPCSAGLIFQDCKASPILDSLLLSDEIGATGDRNGEHDAATSVLRLLAVTYQDESEDSGLRDSNMKFAVVEPEQGGICSHPHSSLVSNDEVGCTVDAPWHCAKEEVDCASALGSIDKLLENNSTTGTPSNELDKFVCKEVLLQSDDGTYVITEGTPEMEAGLLVHNEQNCHLQLSQSEFEGASTAMEMGSILPGCQEESALWSEGGHYCLEEREPFADAEKVSHVESQILKDPTVSKVNLDGKSTEPVFSTPTMETSSMPEEICKNLEETCFEEASCPESRIQPDKSRPESNHVTLCTNGLESNKLGQDCLLGISSTLAGQSTRVGLQFVTNEVDKAENQIAVDRTNHKTMYKASLAVEKCSPPDFVKSRLHAKHVTINPVANCRINLNCRQGEQRDQSTFSLIESRATPDMGNKRLIRGQDNDGMESEEGHLHVTDKELLKTSASIGEPFCNASSDNPLESSSSSTLPSPHFLCLEHALEARHQLKLLGGSNMVIICHSDISKIEDHAQHFVEELNLSHSSRSIPVKEANQEEKNLINMALNIEEEGEDSSNDWVVQLGMSVRHCRDKVWSNHTKCLYNDKGTDVNCKRKAGSVFRVDDVRGYHAVGKVSEYKNSVAGYWCGKVWLNNQAHPVLGGCHTATTPLQSFHLSVEDNAVEEKTASSEQNCTGDLMDVMEGVIESCQAMNDVNTMPNSQCKSIPQRINKKRKSVNQTGTSIKAESDFSVEYSELKRRELAADTVTIDTSCLTSAVKKASISPNETGDLDNPVAGKKSLTIKSNMPAGTEITNSKAGNDHVSDVTMIDHEGSDVDIWQDLDVGCYSQEVLSLDNMGGVTDTLMVDNCHRMDAESQENLLIPAILRRRSCSVFDGEAQSQSLGQERDCAVSAFAECSIGEVLHAALEPSMSEGLDYAMGLKRKQDNQIDITNRRVKERNFNPLDISNLSSGDFGHNEQSVPFFEPPRNFNVSLVGEENGGAECVHADANPPGKLRVPCGNSKQGYPRASGQFSPAPPFDFLTRNLGRMNSDSSSGSTQWRLHTSQNSPPLVKCNSKKLGGKNGRKLKKQVNWEQSCKDALNQSLHATDSSDDDMVQKRTLSKGRKKIILDDLPFDCADFLIEGPSTRLRSRKVAKVLGMDDEDVATGRHDDRMVGSGKKPKEPRQRAKKPVLKDLEDEGGAYVCDLDGCSMSFSSRQELNLHKKNACTFTGCGKRFGSHKYLLQHKRVHMDDRPLKCPWNGCKMTFKWKWACTEHYRVHTGERPYVCPIPECGRTFRFVSDFSRHKRKTGHTK